MCGGAAAAAAAAAASSNNNMDQTDCHRLPISRSESLLAQGKKHCGSNTFQVLSLSLSTGGSEISNLAAAREARLPQPHGVRRVQQTQSVGANVKKPGATTTTLPPSFRRSLRRRLIRSALPEAGRAAADACWTWPGPADRNTFSLLPHRSRPLASPTAEQVGAACLSVCSVAVPCAGGSAACEPGGLYSRLLGTLARPVAV
jgi:hypothetical protein